ncbi:MAG: T9SS type A sorting domain-containing protein, partial [Ignavibacteriales bacterium]|nr:T9SS type A sorting domain-containing protein [Ignavibacteriales bacterium]
TAQGNFVDETASRIPPGLHSAQDVEVFDCDGDGDLDIFLGGYGCGNPYPAANLLINDGTGFFTDQSNLRLPNVSSQTFVSFAKSARLDTGNSNDIAVILFGVIDPQDSIQRRFSKPEIWLNNGAGYFRRDSLGRMPDTAKYGFFDLFISDLNKDTLSDIVFSNFYTLITRPSDPTPVDSLSGQTAFFRNEGNGYFVDETMTHMPEGFHRMTRDLAFADIDGDGDLDILEVGLSFSLQSPLVRLFLNDGTGRFSISSNSGFENLAGHFNGAKFGLLNNDNLPDLFMTKVFPGVPDYDVLMINKGDGSFADSSSLLPQIQDFSVACALFDHERDHDLDIVIANSGPRADTTGQNVLYHNLLYDITDGIGDDPTVAGVFSLSQNYPNPFNPSTSISYTLAKGGNVRLSVYNLMGQLIGVLIDGVQEAGSHSTLWRPDHVSTGIYFYQISVDGRVLDRKKAIYVR